MNNKIHTLKLGYSNAFCIESDDGLSLIDTGLKNNLKKVEKLLQEIGFELKDIKRILITHAHPDHIGSLAELSVATKAEIWASTTEVGILSGDSMIQNAKPADLSLFGRSLLAIASKPERLNFKIDRELKDTEILDEIFSGLEVIHLPGHTMGQIGFWHASSKTLIGGDVMMRLGNRLTMPIRAFSIDWEETKKSIIKVADLKPSNLYLGHGKPIIGDLEELLKTLIKRISNN